MDLIGSLATVWEFRTTNLEVRTGACSRLTQLAQHNNRKARGYSQGLFGPKKAFLGFKRHRHPRFAREGVGRVVAAFSSSCERP